MAKCVRDAFVTVLATTVYSAAAQNWGQANCPCLKTEHERIVKSHKKVDCTESYAVDKKCVSVTVNDKPFNYPPNYGISCDEYIEPGHTSCYNVEAGTALPRGSGVATTTAETTTAGTTAAGTTAAGTTAAGTTAAGTTAAATTAAGTTAAATTAAARRAAATTAATTAAATTAPTTTTSTAAVGTTVRAFAKEWCFKVWCYVDECNCADKDAAESTYFTGTKMFYSYATCGNKDIYTSDEATGMDQTKKVCGTDGSTSSTTRFCPVNGWIAFLILFSSVTSSLFK